MDGSGSGPGSSPGPRRRRRSRFGVALAAVAVAAVTATAGGTAHASAVTRSPASPATGSTTPSWPIDNLGQPVVRALSTSATLGGGGSVSDGVNVPAPSASGSAIATPGAAASTAVPGAATPGAATPGAAASVSGPAGGDTGTGGSEVVGQATNGDPTAYFLNMGNYSDENSEFVAVDLETSKVTLDTRVPSGYANDGMAYSSADNAVFMATGGSDLSEYQLGGTSVTDLGAAISGQTIWSLAAGSDGTIWGGTYPGGDIFSYDPTTGTFHNYGQAISGETYITALDPTSTGVYFGTQPDTDFGELDPSTGAFTQIPLPSAYAGQAGDVIGISQIDTRVFVTINANVDDGLVWDTGSQSWVATLPDFSSHSVSPPDPASPDIVYYDSSNSGVVAYNYETLTGTAIGWSPSAIPGAWAWVPLSGSSYPGDTLMFTYYTNDRIYGYNPATKATYYDQPPVQGSGDQLITLREGPNGDVDAGAYLTPPGMGQWDPSTDSWSLLAGSGQVEGYGDYNGELVWGRYPQGALYYDNLSSAWNPVTNVTIGDDQNRPITFAEINNLEAVGSVPVSGRLGGDISLWDPPTGALTVYHAPIPDQTPISLVAYDGLLWGGTSINGGYGINPVATSGELFAFDPSTGKVVFQLVPKKGAANVSGLVLDSQGNLWGLADSTLFEFDPRTRHIVREEALASTVDGSMYGQENELVFDQGRLFATTDEKLFHIDTVTWKAETLYDGPASDLTQDGNGQLYFIQEPSYVYRYDLPTTVHTPAVTADVTPARADRASPGPARLVTLTASEPGGVGISEVDYRVGDGPWRVYDGQPIAVSGDQVVSYRAVDNAWSASAIQRIRA